MRIVRSLALVIACGAQVAAAQTDSTPAAQAPPAADTVAPGTIAEQAFSFASNGLTLSGTITLPGVVDGPAPIVVIVAGSGPTDRDGNAVTGGLRTNTYAQLAWRLAERGIASLRYDKRVLPATLGDVDMSALTIDAFARDVAAAATAVAADSQFSTVVVAGHSEGASLAIRAAGSGLVIDGLVLLAGPGRPMRQILREQLARQLDAATLAIFDTAMTRYLAGESTGDVPGALLPLLAPVNRTFVRSLFAHSPTEELAALQIPVLIVQGATDIQIRVRDAQALHGARPDAQLVVIPDANHLFKPASDTTLAAQLATYTDPTRPIVAALVDAVATFVLTLPSP